MVDVSLEQAARFFHTVDVNLNPDDNDGGLHAGDRKCACL